MKKNTLIFAFLALSFLLLAQPTTITWQGKLLDASGNAISQNNVAMTFVLFDASTGGNQLWPASGVVAKVVDVVNGLYSVQLGTGTGDDIAFTAAMFNGKTPWLEVKVGTETLPRTEITNVPFALISNELSDAGWETPGEIGKTTPNTGKFTTVETSGLKVATGASNGKVLTSDANGNASWETLSGLETDPVFEISAAKSISSTDITNWNNKISSQWTTSVSNIYYSSGNVGIGNSAPKAPLEFGNVTGNRKIVFYTSADNDHQFTGFGLNNDALRFQLGNTTGSFKFYGATSASASAEVFRIQGDGNVVAQGQIKNVTDPTDEQDATTKAYVDVLKTQLMVLEDMLIETGAYKIFDADSNIYHVVRIGSQLWMNENLKTTKYNDNTEIPIVTDPTEWAGLTTPAYAWYSNNFETYGSVYGALYNWYAVDTATNGHKNICPVGWHVPSISDWNTLVNFLGGGSIAGGKLKSTRTDPDPHPRWNSPNTGATNQSGFNALPGGYRYYTNGQFAYLGHRGYWWSSTKYSDTRFWSPSISTNGTDIINYASTATFGFSVRCIRD